MTTITFSAKYQRILDDFEHHIIVTGGAGTGKTTLLLHKIARILAQGRATPEEIFVFCPTHASLKQLMMHLSGMFPADVINGLRLTTYEAFCTSLLRTFGEHISLPPHFVVFDRVDQLRILMDITTRGDARTSSLLTPHVLRTMIGDLKENLVDYARYCEDTQAFYYDDRIKKVYKMYEDALRRNHAVDSQDLVLNAVKLLEGDCEIVRQYHGHVQFIFAEHYEDISFGMHRLLRLLLDHKARLFAVGDVCQNIRAVGRKQLTDFNHLDQVFPNVHYYHLTENCRSSLPVVSILNQTVACKEHMAHMESLRSKGESASYFRAYDSQEEMNFILREVGRLHHQEQIPLHKIGILYRTESQGKILADYFTSEGLMVSHNKKKSLYSRSEMRDILAYLRLVINPNDNHGFFQVVRNSCPELDFDDLDRIFTAVEKQGKSVWQLFQAGELPVDNYGLGKVERFFEMMDELRDMYFHLQPYSLYHLLKMILEQTGYLETLKQENTLESLENMAYLKELVEAVKTEGMTIDSFFAHYFQAEASGDGISQEGSVVLMTLEQSKGYEFEAVFITGVEEGLLPHYSAQFDQNMLDAEERLFYLGVSRARQYIYFTTAYQRSIFGEVWYNEESRFLQRLSKRIVARFISERLMDFNETFRESFENEVYALNTPHSTELPGFDTKALHVGDVIHHPEWGKGIIQKIEGGGGRKLSVSCFRTGNAG